ncbi:MAG TPA: ATP-binding cassette domain-containing protein [Candidatus Limosilactobacillus faecipullorum]|nr:ATP-binding cassette domain-containing protein [Candidatus Limosilactobacillus faecipullorum]
MGLLLEVIALGIQIYIPRLDKELITVLQKVDLWESLREEGGLDYVIDEQNSLSRGQLPKLAIARSLLGNTNVLVLDEITSSLNKESTNKIEEIINSLGNDITIIEVTHSEPLKSHSIPIKIGENEDN